MATKAKSKSQEKRIAAQKRIEPLAKDIEKDAEVETVDTKDVTNEILARIKTLEEKQTIMIDGYAFISSQVTGLFGMGGLGAVFDAISEKLSGK